MSIAGPPDEFVEVISFSTSETKMPRVVLDGFTSGTANEFGFDLLKGAGSMSPSEGAARFLETWQLLASATRPPSFAQAAKEAVRMSPLFPTVSKLRAVARRSGIRGR